MGAEPQSAEMTCNDMCGDDEPECLDACNACLPNSDMFSAEMYDCMEKMMEEMMKDTEAEHQHDHSDEQHVVLDDYEAKLGYNDFDFDYGGMDEAPAARRQPFNDPTCADTNPSKPYWDGSQCVATPQ